MPLDVIDIDVNCNFYQREAYLPGSDLKRYDIGVKRRSIGGTKELHRLPSGEVFHNQIKRINPQSVFIQAANHITKSCSKRENGPSNFVIRKVFPLTGKKSHQIVGRFNSIDQGSSNSVARVLFEPDDANVAQTTINQSSLSHTPIDNMMTRVNSQHGFVSKFNQNGSPRQVCEDHNVSILQGCRRSPNKSSITTQKPNSKLTKIDIS